MPGVRPGRFCNTRPFRRLTRAGSFDLSAARTAENVSTARALRREYEDKLFFLLAKRRAKKLLLPLPVRTLLTAVKSIRYIFEGLRCLAARLGLDEFYAEVLLEDKAAFIRSEHLLGRKVVMIGDGVN